jgi:hypothetical protein
VGTKINVNLEDKVYAGKTIIAELD